MDQQPQTKKDEILASEKPRVRSKGEKLFDDVVYTGINGVGTFFLTLWMAYELKFGHGKPLFDKAATGLEKKLTILPESWRQGFAKSFLNTTVLMQGGNVMLLPVGWAEQQKVRIVQGLNVMLGDKTDPATIEEAPKQTLGSLLLGRLRAFGVVFAAFASMGMLFGKQMGQFEEAVGRGFKAFRDNKTPELQLQDQRYGELAALDVFATAAASILMYDGSHKAAEKREQRRHPQTYRPINRGATFDGLDQSTPNDTPSTSISHSRHEAMLAEAPQKAMGAPA
jgi:hypothetical protein